MYMTTLAERLKIARESISTGQKEMAELLDISFRSWQDYELGKSVPGGKVFEALSRLGFNANWLLTCEGSMKRGGESVPEKGGGELDQDEYALVPRYGVKASAGHGALVESEQVVDHMAFKRLWIRTMGLEVGHLALISAKGDSMEPTIRDGFLLLVDLRVRTVKDDAIYILRLDGMLIAKRLQRMFDGSVKIKSDNHAYDEQVVPADNVEKLNVIGRVVWGGGKM